MNGQNFRTANFKFSSLFKTPKLQLKEMRNLYSKKFFNLLTFFILLLNIYVWCGIIATNVDYAIKCAELLKNGKIMNFSLTIFSEHIVLGYTSPSL